MAEAEKNAARTNSMKEGVVPIGVYRGKGRAVVDPWQLFRIFTSP
jgi:hypothetical protein